MRIIKLETRDIKRIKAVSVTPEGDAVIVAGRNEQGKSSLLDSIQMALGGKRAIPPKPVRDGEESGYVVCDLGDIIVKRTFRADGKTNLVIENRDGDTKKSPQALLDKLVGQLSFDPLEFCRMKSPEQMALLKRLCGVDLDQLEADREKKYKERTKLNAEVKALDSILANTTTYPDAPAEEILIDEVTAEFTAATENHQAFKTKEEGADRIAENIKRLGPSIETKRKELEALVTREKEAVTALEARRHLLAEEKELLPDLEEIKARTISVGETNGQVRANKGYNENVDARDSKRELSSAATECIADLDAAKKKAIAEADIPVDGLSFDESNVLLNGIPFSQASSAVQTRVSMAMGIALNPDLRILLIRNGSLLDDDSMKMVSEFAEQNDCQCWIERVGDDANATVVIEDGEIKA